MTTWILDPNGKSASNGYESRLISAIPATDTILPCPPQPLQPNPDGFINAIKTAMGGIVAAAAMPNAAIFNAAVKQGVWADVQALIINANTTLGINATQYAAIKAAAIANNIPVTLP